MNKIGIIDICFSAVIIVTYISMIGLICWGIYTLIKETSTK